MRTETVNPDNREAWLKIRRQNINSTESSALFGLNKYLTEFELFHQLRDQKVVEVDVGERGSWGNRLQNVIFTSIAEDEGWQDIRPMDEYIYSPELRAGSSFDFAIGKEGIGEVKNVDYFKYKNDWYIDDNGNIESTPYIEMQIQHQLWISGRKFAKLTALIGGNKKVVIHREPDSKVISMIESRIAEFWKMVDAGTPPMPDFARDSDFICSLYGYSDPGLIMNAQDNPAVNTLAAEYRTLGEQSKLIESSRDEIKARLMTMIGAAEKVLGNGFTISAKTTPEAEVAAYTRKSFRALRFSWSKTKGEQ